jgi:hypothetical protein
MNDLDLIAATDEDALLPQPALKEIDKMAVDLDGVEAVARQHAAGDLARHRAGAGTDFENTARQMRAA